MSTAEISTSNENTPLNPSAAAPQPPIRPREQQPPLTAGHFYPTRNTRFSIKVTRPKLELIGNRQVEFYQVGTQTDYEGFSQRTIIVPRRYSEFQTLRKVLVAKGANPLWLSRTQIIPGYMSKWEELNKWTKHLGQLKFNEDCLKEMKRFFYDQSPYEAEQMLTGIWFVDRLLIRL